MITINSFDGITLTGANKTRYVPIWGNSAGIIGAYRKAMGVKTIAHVKRYGTIEIGLTPLFLLDGDLSPQVLIKAVKTLDLTAYVAIYRPFDVKLKARLEETYRICFKGGFIKKDGSSPEWVLEDKLKAESIRDEHTNFRLRAIQPYLNYEKALSEYTATISTFPVDAETGQKITGDINRHLFGRAKDMFPLGVENVLKSNIKQSAIPKCRFFVDGLENAPAPKDVKQRAKDDGQVDLLEADRIRVDDTVEELRGFFGSSIEQCGAVRLTDMIEHCAHIGLYKGNVTLYALGAACRFLDDNAVFYDGVCYWRYTEVRDISSWLLYGYDVFRKCKASSLNRPAAIFYDDTMLKARLEEVFDLKPATDKRLDTLGMTVVMIGIWIKEHLRYPIAFLDDMLYRLYNERTLYGENLRKYDTYFTDERCEWLKTQMPHADAAARQAITDIVGFDPDTTKHGMSNLPKGHYAPVLFSTEAYVEEMLRKPRVPA